MTYTYKCDKEHVFEVQKPLKDINRVEKCPRCGAVSERIIRHTNLVVYKTGGFYNTGDLQ